MAARVKRRHRVTVRTVDLRRFDAELAVLQSIYREAWQDNWGATPITEAETRYRRALAIEEKLDPGSLSQAAALEGLGKYSQWHGDLATARRHRFEA